jgi:digeranylgeranylglycerophospholipid reductase
MRRLFERAAAAGCDARLDHEVVDVHRDRQGTLTSVTVRAPTGTETIHCDALVAADGIAGGVGRLAGIDTCLEVAEIYACAQYRLTSIQVPRGTCEFWIGDVFAPGGYAWVFPRSADEANVGLAIVADRPSAEGRTATEWLKRFRRRRFPEGSRIESYITGGIPVLVRRPPSAADGVVLAGDAARSADPLSAAGIAEAMDSGRHAAIALAQALEAGDLAAARLERGARAFAAAHRGRKVTTAIRRIYDRLDDAQKSALVAACHDLFHDRRVDAVDPGRMFLDLLRHSPRLLGFARGLLPLVR